MLMSMAFPVISSSLGISRWKDMNQINDSGTRAAARYPEMVYWTYNWRKGGGAARMYEILQNEKIFYQTGILWLRLLIL